MVKTKLEIISKNTQFKKFFGVTPLMAASVRVTKACNLKCSHCYANGGCPLKGELTTKEMLSVVDQFANLGVLHIFYTGGEPFLRKDIVELLRFARNKDYSVYTSTNGTVIKEDQIRSISDLRLKVFQVSIDGLAQTHDHIRGVKGSFDKALKTMKLATKYFKHTKVALAFTLMKQNHKEVLTVLDLAIRNDIDIFALIPLFPSGTMQNDDDLTTKEKSDVFKSLCSYYLKSCDLSNSSYLSILSSPGIIPANIKSVEFGCGFICTFPNILGLDSNGDVYPCDGLIGTSEMFLGNIRKKSLKEIWNHPKLKELRNINYSKLRGVCKICTYRSQCMGGCRAYAYKKTGNFFASDPLCQSFYEENVFPRKNLAI